MSVRESVALASQNLAIMSAGQTFIATKGPVEKITAVFEKLKKYPPFLAVLQQHGITDKIQTLDCVLNPASQMIKFEVHDTRGKYASIPIVEFTDVEIQKAALFLSNGREEFEPKFEQSRSPQPSLPMPSEVERTSQVGGKHLTSRSESSRPVEQLPENPLIWKQMYELFQKSIERQDRILEMLLEQNKKLQERFLAVTPPPVQFTA